MCVCVWDTNSFCKNSVHFDHFLINEGIRVPSICCGCAYMLLRKLLNKDCGTNYVVSLCGGRARSMRFIVKSERYEAIFSSTFYKYV